MSRSAGTSTVARVNGIELAYQVFGSGSPLILIHGGFGSVEMFGPNGTSCRSTPLPAPIYLSSLIEKL